jgi:hypothetical protein
MSINNWQYIKHELLNFKLISYTTTARLHIRTIDLRQFQSMLQLTVYCRRRRRRIRRLILSGLPTCWQSTTNFSYINSVCIKSAAVNCSRVIFVAICDNTHTQNNISERIVKRIRIKRNLVFILNKQ